MRIRQLHYFMALAKYLNFKFAANALNIAQSGLSQQISDLEYELGFKLFSRNKKRIELTTAGIELMQRLPEIFKLLDQSIAIMQDYHEHSSREILHIGFEPPIAANNIIFYISKFREENPDVHCLADHYTFEMLKSALKDGNIDVGFFLMPSGGFSCSIDFQTISVDDLVLVIRKELIDTKNASISKVISSRPLFCFEKSAGGTDTLLGLCHEMKVIPDICFCSKIDEIICNVESGLGFAILPKNYVNSMCNLENLLIIDLSGFEKSNICMIAGVKRENTSPAVLRFLSSLPRIEPHCGSCFHTDCQRYSGVKPTFFHNELLELI